jgi:lipoate---protein ligase
LAERAFREEIGTDSYVAMLDAPPADDALVSASLTSRGGSVRADIRLEGTRRDRIREVLITGDFFITPPRVVFDLEAALRGLNVSDAGEAADNFFRRTPTDFLSLSAGDLRQVIEIALRQRNITAAAG